MATPQRCIRLDDITWQAAGLRADAEFGGNRSAVVTAALRGFLGLVPAHDTGELDDLRERVSRLERMTSGGQPRYDGGDWPEVD